MVTGTTLSRAFPLASRLDERGRLEVGGCDAIELAREFGTPAYVVAEEDLSTCARAFLAAGREAGQDDLQVVFASKAFPCTAVLELFALGAGFAPERIVLHGNAKSEAELQMALNSRVGLIVLDNFDEIDRLERLIAEGDRGGAPQNVLVRVTPDVRGETHEKISTGQADSKFGFAMADATAAIARARSAEGLSLQGLHAHIGSQLLSLEPFERAAAELARLGEFAVLDLGGGLGVSYTEDQPAPPSVQEYVGAIVAAVRAAGIGERTRLMIEPGRSLCANAAVTLYTVESVKQNVSRWVAVDGGMSDNMRPMLYGSVYEAQIADRFGGGTPVKVVGKHCESGDVIVREARLDDPRPGDVIATPATGAYGYAMASNYNGVPRPPVIFCRDGDARVVVRRETFEDLTARDVQSRDVAP
jgi:diaminopimelate decarboxylase